MVIAVMYVLPCWYEADESGMVTVMSRVDVRSGLRESICAENDPIE